MSEKSRLLIVDDDHDIREPLARYLGQNGYEVRTAESAKFARTILTATPVDLVLLDVMMPGEDGLALLSFIRATSKLPVILLTARVEEMDKIVGLEIGADDYVTKPFSPRELLARVKALLRRSSDGMQPIRIDDQVLAFDSWILKLGGMELVDDLGVVHPLSTGEFKLLHALAMRPKQVLSRDNLLDIMHSREGGPFDRSIDNHVSRLRKKLERDPRDPKLIKTVWGGGYMLNAEVRKL
jgi:two-component system, OmpR family, response regulator